MEKIKITTGNILNDSSSFIVCPVNCVGVMGAGLAKQFKNQIPGCFEAYLSLLGQIQREGYGFWKNVCFLATKDHWKNPSQKPFIINNLKNLSEGLRCLKHCYGEKASIAFPMLGCGCGQLNEDDMLITMKTMFEFNNNFSDWKITIYN